MARERRRNRQLTGVEAVGRLLAEDPSPHFAGPGGRPPCRRFGYTLSRSTSRTRTAPWCLGAQRGYDRVLERFDGTTGVVGRVMRTGKVQFDQGNVSSGPRRPTSANDTVRSEISAPLFAGGDLIGVLNLEDLRVGGLDETDRSTLVLVAERIAGSIALGRDRQALTERAARFAALAQFARLINESLDPHEVYPAASATPYRS